MAEPVRPDPAAGSESVAAVRLTRQADSWCREETSVDLVTEVPISLEVVGVVRYTIMATPRDLQALALGFLASEGLIGGAADLAALEIAGDDPHALVARLATPPDAGQASSTTVTVLTAAGRAADGSAAAVIADLPRVGHTFSTSPEAILAAHAAMCDGQVIRRRTRAAHAAALFDAAGRVVAAAEDVGRHNAVDKVVGAMLSREQRTAGSGLLLSGRVSLEMVAKAARAGAELIAAVSAPTSLAVTAAAACGITLCTGIDGTSLTALTHPARIR